MSKFFTIRSDITGRVLCSGTANGNYQITDFRLGISKKVSNIISITIKNT